MLAISTDTHMQFSFIYHSLAALEKKKATEVLREELQLHSLPVFDESICSTVTVCKETQMTC